MKVRKALVLLDCINIVGASTVDERMSALKAAFKSVNEYKIGKNHSIMEPHRALIPMMYKEYGEILFRENDTFECVWKKKDTLSVYYKTWKVERAE